MGVDRLDIQLHRLRVQARLHPHIDAEVLHRRIDELLDGDGQPVDLVDEHHVTVRNARERSHQVGRAGERGAAGDVDLAPHLLGDDVR